MAEQKYRVTDLVAEHPGLDHVAAGGGALVWLLFLRDLQVTNVEDFLVGLATISALVLAAAAFVCALTYQSGSDRVADLQILYGAELRRNWVSIFAMTFLTSVAPLIAILFIGKAGVAVPLVAAWSLTMLAVKAARTIYWLNYMLFTQYVDGRRPRRLHSADDQTDRPLRAS